MYCKVIVPIPLEKEYIYSFDDDLFIKKGHVVLVPFGKRKEEIGVVSVVFSKLGENNSNLKLKKVIKIINNIKLKSSILEFSNWVANYTLNPKGLIFKMILPNKKIINFKNKSKIIKDNKISKKKINTKIPVLNSEQKVAYNLIRKNLKFEQKTIVLEGVTGSGKTEVYFEAIEYILKKNLQVLILLPEITLTPQIEKRFFIRFGFYPDIWHSKVSESKKRKIWINCYKGNSKIIIGARSSLFLPFNKLGLIVADEEHDASYKQEDGVRYHARDMSIVRSKFEQIPIILSTATPSIETFYNIRQNRYVHVILSKQYSGYDLPNINLIDLQSKKLEKNKWISKEIIENISKCLDKKKQSLVFLNKRGYAPLTVCSSCGYRSKCKNCESWLVLHNKKNKLFCHHCGYSTSVSITCPKCNKNNSLKFVGPGVERISDELINYFPKSKIEIMSSDTMNTPNKIKKIISRVELKEIDILVGTQILAKGYHFPSLSLVAVLDADAGLMGGDLRASEHTYNLLQQVSGRAGRAKTTGKVYIQSYYCKNPLIKSLKDRDRSSFFNQTLLERKSFNLPPYTHLISIIISSASKIDLLDFANKMSKNAPTKKEITLLGPVEAPLFLLRGRYRYRFLLKGNTRKGLNEFTKNWLKKINFYRNIRLSIDVDPYSFT